MLYKMRWLLIQKRSVQFMMKQQFNEDEKLYKM